MPALSCERLTAGGCDRRMGADVVHDLLFLFHCLIDQLISSYSFPIILKNYPYSISGMDITEMAL